MTSENQILNWLRIGISQSPFSLNEIFYLDKKNNEFFSVLATDYFMFDDSFEVAKNTTTTYSQQNQNSLVSRMQRIENDDNEIIEIPKLSYNERKEILIEFLDSISDGQEKEKVAKLYLNSDGTIFNLKFEIKSTKEIMGKWEVLRTRILTEKAESFLNLNNITLSNTQLWEVDEEGSISIDLTKDDNGTPLKRKNKWWELWK